MLLTLVILRGASFRSAAGAAGAVSHGRLAAPAPAASLSQERLSMRDLQAMGLGSGQRVRPGTPPLERRTRSGSRRIFDGMTVWGRSVVAGFVGPFSGRHGPTSPVRWWRSAGTAGGRRRRAALAATRGPPA